jgi:hypothetical protein
VAISNCDRVGVTPLSAEADVILGIALTYPQFLVPGKRELWQLQVERAQRSGSKYRHFGINRVQDALNELQEKGFYGWRRVTAGRQPGGRADWAYVRSYGNEPWKHLAALEELSADQIRDYHQATKAAWLERSQPAARPGPTNVVSLDSHRLNRAG